MRIDTPWSAVLQVRLFAETVSETNVYEWLRPGVGAVPLFNQRGNPFGRVKDGDVVGARIDIGAFEVQPDGPACLVI